MLLMLLRRGGVCVFFCFVLFCKAKLLTTLGVSPVAWTLVPSLGAALVAGPLLTIAATLVAVSLGALPLYLRLQLTKRIKHLPLMGQDVVVNPQERRTLRLG